MDNSIKRLHMVALIKLSRASGQYPECMVLKGVQRIGKHPVARGSFGEVWKGTYEGKLIAVKVLHVYEKSDLVRLLKVWLLDPSYRMSYN